MTDVATIPGDAVTLPSLESVFKAVRRVRAAEEKLIQERRLRDDEMLRVVEEQHMQPATLARRLYDRFGDSPGISVEKIRQALRDARARKKDSD
jgi:AraC-like DNA-binding protein